MSDRQIVTAILVGELRRLELLLAAPGSTIDLNRPADAAAFGGGSALSLAVVFRRIDMIRLFLQHRANPDLQDHRGWTALHHAIEQYRNSDAATVTAMTRVLLEGGADPNIPDENGDTPLRLACLRNITNATKAMLENGGDVTMAASNGRLPILEAAALYGVGLSNGADFLRMLLECGGNANHRDRNGKSLLHLAAARDRSKKVEVLLESGANVNAGDSQGQVPLQTACESGSTSSIFVLFRRMVGDGSISLDRNRD